MIVSLKGILEEKNPSSVVIDAGGVGYEVFISLGTYDRLPAGGAECKLHIYHHIREDAQMLFGFATKEEKHMFLRLLQVSGVGPKLALSVLSGMTVADLAGCISSGDSKRLSSIHGIGKKSAERIIVELKDKIDPLEAFAVAGSGGGPSAQKAVVMDTALALEALGYSQDQARKMVLAAHNAHPEVEDTQTLLRMALKQ